MRDVVRSQLVATVLEVFVQAGTPVASGDALVLLESMKMEIPVLAERSGTLAEVHVSTGDVVQEGDPLATIEA